MQWYNYLAVFFGGAFLANSVPHFVQGICGNKFPTPFAKPPGKGLSSSLVNVIWGGFNMIAGYFLTRAGQPSRVNWPSLTLFFVGAAVMSIMLAINFQHKEKG
jgi:hypothetical protein